MRFQTLFSVLALSVAATSAQNSNAAVATTSDAVEKRTLSVLNPLCWLGKCPDTTSDPLNCGRIGNICALNWQYGWGAQCVNSVCMPQKCQSGCVLHQSSASCVPVSDDVNNCGAVGNKCSLANASSQKCVSGTCVATACASGYDLSSGQCVKHYDLQNDSNNCGSVGNKCSSWFLNGNGSQCKNGVCQPISCNNGCLWHQGSSTCKDVTSDPNNCGAIGNVCSFPNGSGTCSSGKCTLTKCSSGYTLSGGKCVWLDLQNDPNNCGTAGNQCQYANGVGQCQNGKCSLKSCNTGYTPNGQSCQWVNTQTDPNNCGSVGFKCPSTYLNGGSPVCSNGKCSCNCNSGFLWDWGLNFCRPIKDDCNNCGAIGNKCSIPNGTPNCKNGVCGLESCNSGYQPSNGKCIPIDHQTDSQNCGWLGNSCSSNIANGQPSVCILGKCVSICNTGFDWDPLGLFCRNVQSDPQNCGKCGQTCNIANAVSTQCVKGSCKVTACASGYEISSDGTKCNQIDTNTNPNHCGWFGNCCKFTPQGATGICKNGKCVATYCPPPYWLSNGVCTMMPSGKARLAKKSAAPVKRTLCPAGEEACPIAGSASFSTSFTQQLASLENAVNPGGFECVDTRTALDSCGGCTSTGSGVDCTLIPNSAGVGCDDGTCVVFSCSAGYRPSIDGTSCVRVGGSSHRNGTEAAKRHLKSRNHQRAAAHHHS